MSFGVSAGVVIQEVDLTTVVPTVSTTVGAIGGVTSWGPVEDRTLVGSQDEFALRFGKPNDDNYETFFSAANFLDYGNQLWFSRAASSNTYNALAVSNTQQAAVSNTQVKNSIDYSQQTFANTQVQYIAKWPSSLGNSLQISVCDSANAYSKSITIANTTVAFTVGSNTAVVTATGNSAPILTSLSVNDYVSIGNTTIGTQYLSIASIGSPTTANGVTTANITFNERYYLTQDYTETAAIKRYWQYFRYVSGAPTTSAYTDARGGSSDEMHIIVLDRLGKFTGTPGQVLETFENVSRVKGALAEQGGSIYYPDVLNQSSQYVWFANSRVGADLIADASTAVAATTDAAYTANFSGGTDGASESTIPLGNMINAYNEFREKNEVDIALIMNGKSVESHGVRGMGLAQYIIESIAEYRLDCIALISPQLSDVVNNPFQEAEAILATRNVLESTSYGVMDSGYKYQYDKYNDTYRWVPLNGDIGGLIVRTATTNDAWWSPAGFNRGIIKNVVKLAYNPEEDERDLLYAANINPVVTFVGEGTILYGDKTLQTKASAFDRINVRRLFIVLEKAISTAAKYTLFEFNDDFTRAQFRNMVEPYLRDILGRRGIYDYKVICDTTNNTPAVIDANEFIGDIYIKPARSINYIKLRFVAVGTGVDFSTVVGSF
jgi:phage tail sheath protein FI